MYLCMYVCMYARMYVCIYVCTYVCSYVCTFYLARISQQSSQLTPSSHDVLLVRELHRTVSAIRVPLYHLSASIFWIQVLCSINTNSILIIQHYWHTNARHWRVPISLQVIHDIYFFMNWAIVMCMRKWNQPGVVLNYGYCSKHRSFFAFSCDQSYVGATHPICPGPVGHRRRWGLQDNFSPEFQWQAWPAWNMPLIDN